MKNDLIEKVVKEVHETATANIASDSKYALSRYVEQHTTLSYKTVQRAFDKYVNGQKEIGRPSEETINILCVFLEYDDYADFVKKNRSSKKFKWPVVIGMSLLFGAVCLLLYSNYPFDKNSDLSSSNCMIWKETQYVETSCKSQIGLNVEQYDAIKMANFKRVDVSLTTEFFEEETEKPLIWYYKTKDNTIEYFTAPGEHPIHKKTLKAITKYIIEKEVPKHTNQADSFLGN